MKIKVVAMIIIAMLFLSSCGPEQLMGPTLIPAATNTQAPANTQTPVVTPSAILTSTVTETETRTQITIPSHIPTFTLIPTFESTQVIVFHPTDVPAQERTGSCWSSSIVLNRVDAWRCNQDDMIYDPCFSIPGNSQAVICDATPYDNRTGFKLNLTEPLPALSTIPNPLSAWVFELADGTICSSLGGASAVFGGKRVNYSCSDGWYILGEAQPDQIWKAQKIRPSSDFSSIMESVWVSIMIVWL